MDPIEQGKLFVATQRRYRDWTIKHVSGYVHGVVDGLNRDKPQEVYVQRLLKPKRNLYTIGYITGFIDAQGNDVAFDLGMRFKFAPKTIDYRWWESKIPS